MELRLVTILAAGLALWSAPARADEAAAKIKDLAGKARAHYQLGKYDLAAQEYEKAYELKAVPGLLFNIAQCYRLLGEPAKAEKLYASYLRDAPDAPNADEVQRYIAEMREQQKKLAKAAPPAPPPAKAAEPPVAAARVAADPAPAPEARMPALPPPPPPVAAPAKPAGWAHWAVAGVAGAAGLGLGALAASDYGTSTTERGYADADQASALGASSSTFAGHDSAATGARNAALASGAGALVLLGVAVVSGVALKF